MTKDKSIFIKNIYYMLSYAFQTLNQENYDDVATESFDEMYDLLAAILAKGIGIQLKQGLYREYINRQEELPVMRGKINLPGTIKNRLARKQLLTCDYDELSENNLLNQIIKTAVMLLLRNAKVKAEYRDDLKKKMLFFSNVDLIEPTSIRWSSIRFQRNNQTYRMLISICQLIIEGMLITTDRLQSSSGDWSGNVFDFFFRVNSKIAKDIKKPFKLEGITRVDDTPVHKAVREALVNCLVNTDYFLPCGVVIKKEDDKLVIENPGSIRTGKKQMLRGGISDPRNKTLMKMFNMIGIGERAGSGIPDIYQVWENEGWPMPVVEESYNPDRTRLSLEFKKQANKTSEQNKHRKTEENYQLIRKYLKENGLSKTTDIAQAIGLSPARTRAILKEMSGLEYEGTTNNRRYRLADDN